MKARYVQKCNREMFEFSGMAVPRTYWKNTDFFSAFKKSSNIPKETIQKVNGDMLL